VETPDRPSVPVQPSVTASLPVSKGTASNVSAVSARAAIRPLQAAAVLAGTILLARVIGLLQYTIINSKLPPGATDAYYAAFRLPDIINYLVAGGAMSVTFIPIFTELKYAAQRTSAEEGGHREEAWHFFSTVATLMGIALILLIVGGVLLAEPLVRLTNPGFTAPDPDKEETLRLAVQMTRIILPAQFFFYLGGMVVGVLNAHKRFGASGMTGAVYNLVAIAIGYAAWLAIGETGFAWGILLGACAGNFLLPLVAARSGPLEERLRFRPSCDWRHPAVRRFFLNALPIMLGVSLPVVDQFVVGFFASYLTTGALTHLQTGNRVMLAPLGIVAQAASVAAFPFLASDSAAHKWDKLSDFLRSGLGRLMFLSLPISMLLILTAQPIINILFGYGKYADDPVALEHTAIAFAFYCVGLFAWVGQQFVARGFYALQDTTTPTIIGSALTIFFFVPLCWAAARWGGVLGLAFATSIGAAAHFCGILIALESKLRSRRYNTHLQTRRITGTLLRTGAATAAMGIAGLLANSAAVWFLTSGKEPVTKLGDLLRIVLVGTVACIAFAAAAQLCAIPEWDWLKGKVARRRARS
jgi:putative peptidoglycan lipid II flippase